MVAGKLIFAVIYVIIAYFIDGSMKIIGFIPYDSFISIYSVAVLSAVIGWLSYNFRVIKIKKHHKGMESEEHAVFNDTVKAKIKFIVKSSDFKVEAIICFVLSVGYMMISFVEVALAYGIGHIFTTPINYLMMLIGFVIIPGYMAALDVFVWFKALNKCYKKKEY